MKKNKKESFFWTSYSDLMTSLFFVMLVLFVLVIVVLHNKMIKIEETYQNYKDTYLELEAKNKELARLKEQTENEKKATEEQLAKIQEIEKATKDIDYRYFEYNTEFKRHTLKNVNVVFRATSANLYDKYTDNDLNDLLEAGRSIVNFMKTKERTLPEANYMLILEGQASKDDYEWNDVLSYERALALYKFWVSHKVPIDKMKNCEVIISGSGYSSRFRAKNNEDNQRFVIHIIPKPGIIGQ